MQVDGDNHGPRYILGLCEHQGVSFRVFLGPQRGTRRPPAKDGEEEEEARRRGKEHQPQAKGGKTTKDEMTTTHNNLKSDLRTSK